MSTESDMDLTDLLPVIDARNSERLHEWITSKQFVLISIADHEEDDEAMGAITAEVDGMDVLVAFTSETLAGEFVDKMSELFADEDQVQGFIVNGDALLDYLPEQYGLLLNPECDQTALIEPTLAQQIGDLSSRG